jgi:hypothetical protein
MYLLSLHNEPVEKLIFKIVIVPIKPVAKKTMIFIENRC